MVEADDTAINKNREFTIPLWDAVAITRQQAEESRIQLDHGVEDLRESMLDEQTLTAFGIDLRQIDG